MILIGKLREGVSEPLLKSVAFVFRMSSFEEIVQSHLTTAQTLWSKKNSTLQSERQAASPEERKYCQAHYFKKKGVSLQKQLCETVRILHSLEQQACEQRNFSIAGRIKNVLDIVDPQPTSPTIRSHSLCAHGLAIASGEGDCGNGDFIIDGELCFSIAQVLIV